MDHSISHAGHSTTAAAYNINFQLSAQPIAGSAVTLSFVVTEQKVGDPIEAFEPLHERLMHLILVNDTLSHFAHIHPVLHDGVFEVAHVFPSPGRYKLWTEVRPTNGDTVLAGFQVTIAPNSTADQTAPEPEFSGYQVTLMPSGRAPLHQEVELVFEVADAEGKPVTDLEPLMGAGGHCVIISTDLRDFVHVHPMEDVRAGWLGGPMVRFSTSFHRPGRYKTWGQFQHHGQLITAGFPLEVDEDSHH